MRFHVTVFLGLVAYAAALPTALHNGDIVEARALKVPPGTPVTDTQGVELKKGQSCTTTSTEGVLGCQDGTGATFNIVNGKIRTRRDEEAQVATEPGEETADGFSAQEASDDEFAAQEAEEDGDSSAQEAADDNDEGAEVDE